MALSPFLVGIIQPPQKIMKMKVYQSIFNFNEIKINKVKIKTIWLDSLEFWNFENKSTKDELGQNLSANILRGLPRQSDHLQPFLTTRFTMFRRPYPSLFACWKKIGPPLSSLTKNWLKNRMRRYLPSPTLQVLGRSWSTLRTVLSKISDQIRLKTFEWK